MKTLEELMALAANCEDAAHELRQAERADASADVIVALRSELWSDRERLRSALAEVVEDAGRYRFLRSRAHETAAWDRYEGSHWAIGIHDPGSRGLDAAIDSARSAA